MTRLADVALAAATRSTRRNSRPRTARRSAPNGHRAGADRRRHGQAGRRRAQRLVRHRPRVRLSRGRRDRAARAAISNREYFDRLGRRVIATLNDVTADGYVFRVDMRLRPYGDSGPLTTSFASLENYLVTQGRAWERYAWLKARALTGARHDELAALVTPFVYRKYLDYDAYEGLRDIHRQIRDQGARRDYAEQREAGRRRHPRDRVHRAGAADRPRRTRAGPARPRHAAGARGARRARAAAALLGRRALATPTCSCATSSTGCSTATTSRRTSCRRTPSERALLAEAMDAAPAAFESALARHRATVSVTFAQTLGDDGRAAGAADATFTTLWEEPALTPDLHERAARARDSPIPRRSRHRWRASADRRATAAAGDFAPALRRAGAAAARRGLRASGTVGRAGRVRAPARAARDRSRAAARISRW